MSDESYRPTRDRPLTRCRRGLADRVGSTPDLSRHDDPTVAHPAHDLAGSAALPRPPPAGPAALAPTGHGHHVERANTNAVSPRKGYVDRARAAPGPPGDLC